MAGVSLNSTSQGSIARSRTAARALAILLATGSVLPAAALAQDEAAAAPQEETASGLETVRGDNGTIVVTARRFVPSGAITASKTTAPLIETPQSVSVISRDQIDLLNFIDVQQAVRYTAGVVGENYGPDLRFDFLTLRGFVPVQYIDGLQAPISATIANVGIDLYGYEAVDILKGSSSVLYGSTPPGGIYNLTSRRPSSKFGGEVRLNYGTDDYKQVAGTVTGELTPGISARLTGLYRDRDSQTAYVTARRGYIAPAVTFDLGPDTKLTVLGNYQWDKVRGDTNGFLPLKGTLFANPLGMIPRDANYGEPGYNFYRRHQWSAGYEFTHRLSPSLRFTQNARWSEYHEYQQIIYGGGGVGGDNRTVGRYNFPSYDDVGQFALDSRFDGSIGTGPVEHRFIAGLDYRNYRETSGFGFGFPNSIDLYNPVYGQETYTVPALGAFTDQRLRQIGLYAQDQAKIGNFILTLSGRQDWVKINDKMPSTAFAIHVPSANKSKFTWRAGATYVADNGIAPYVSYATSFQAVVGGSFSGVAFAPTTGKQWEAGVKYDARGLPKDIKLFATGSVFRIEQQNVLTTDPVNPNFQVQTGKVVSKGVELEAVARIREQLSINASYSYTDAKVTESNNPLEIGARLPAQPQHKVSVFADYTMRSGLLAGAGAGVGVRHLSSSPGILPATVFVGTDSFVSTLTSPAVTLFDATLHYDIPGWRLAVNGSNLFDKTYVGRCGTQGCFYGQSRQVIATLTKTF